MNPIFVFLCVRKANGGKYHVLGGNAKDVLAIQVSTVDSDSAFSPNSFY